MRIVFDGLYLLMKAPIIEIFGTHIQLNTLNEKNCSVVLINIYKQQKSQKIIGKPAQTPVKV